MLLCIKAVGLGSLLSLKEIRTAARNDTNIGKMEVSVACRKFHVIYATHFVSLTPTL
jgi:hypothetical protein